MRTYGRAWRVPKAHGAPAAWVIACEPQVSLRIKRLFEKAAPTDRNAISISETDENCRELLWFFERYPMEIPPKDLRHLRAGARQHARLESDIGDLLGADYKPREYRLAIPPREYQRLVADLMQRRHSLLLADEVGLGKTVSSICTMMIPGALPALVVTLAHLPRQWENEIHRFAPELRTHILRIGTPYDLTAKRGVTGAEPFPDVIITNYHKLASWGTVLAGRMKLAIFDEAQELRHSGTQKYNGALAVAEKAAFRQGLSGTPVYNYGGEIHNVMGVLAPGALGTSAEFQREWCTCTSGYGGATKAIVKDPGALGYYMREQGFMLRRTREDVGRELPAITKVPHYIQADLAELDKVANSVTELAKIILAQGGRGFDKLRAADELDWRLRQATGLAKAPFVAQFVRMLVESGEPVVLYGWHREVYSLWMQQLANLNPVLYTGSESLSEKERSKKAFLSGDAKVLIMSLRSGAGLDGLQERGRTVVFGELDWSPGVMQQCEGRVHRDGQTGSVIAYYLLSDSGSDPVLSGALGLKQQQVAGILNPDSKTLGGTVDIHRVRRLAEAYLEQQGARGKRETNEDEGNEEAA